ncbi:MAG: hypothetical protein ACYC65_06160 [Candidatus Limnocylindrales bacterium]
MSRVLSPAQDLATRTIERLSFSVVTPDVALPLLAGWETLIGLGLLSGRLLRATLFLLALQMAGTAAPLARLPGEASTRLPIAPTPEEANGCIEKRLRSGIWQSDPR